LFAEFSYVENSKHSVDTNFHLILSLSPWIIKRLQRRVETDSESLYRWDRIAYPNSVILAVSFFLRRQVLFNPEEEEEEKEETDNKRT